jgi:hypothetical protein
MSNLNVNLGLKYFISEVKYFIEKFNRLGCNAVQSDRVHPTFRRNILLPSCFGMECKPSSSPFIIACLWFVFIFDSEDGGILFLENFSKLLPDYPALHPRRFYSSLKYSTSEITHLTSKCVLRLSFQITFTSCSLYSVNYL